MAGELRPPDDRPVENVHWPDDAARLDQLRPDGAPRAGPQGPMLMSREEVAVLRWPADASVRSDLARPRRPRLPVLDDDDAPPLVWDDLEDWARATSGAVELTTRVERLTHRRPGPPATAVPVLDADGILTGHGHQVVIPTVEARLLATLLQHRDAIVHRDQLHRAGWPVGGVTGRALDGRITLLRRRIAPLGLTIHTVRGVGYMVRLTPGP